MPTMKLNEIPSAGVRWKNIPGDFYRTTQLGDMEVGFTSLPFTIDCTQTYKDGRLAGGVCGCPHYGYVIKGKIRCVYPGTDLPDDVAQAGAVYYFPAGHVLVYEEPTDAVEFNPAAALQDLMNGMDRAMQRRMADAAAAEADAKTRA
jgi:hypothetical protein